MWPDSDETRQLLDQARDGRPEAVSALLDRHRVTLRRLVELRLDRAVSRRVDASDVVQDVLIEAHRRLSDYLHDPRLPFHLWLRQLAKDQIVDMHRRHRGAQRRSVDREQPATSARADDSLAPDPVLGLRDGELTPAAAVLRRELHERFVAALEQLAEDDRDVILMRHFEHLGNGEVAQALGLSPAAAGMRYLRAVRRLRSLLGEDALPF